MSLKDMNDAWNRNPFHAFGGWLIFILVAGLMSAHIISVGQQAYGSQELTASAYAGTQSPADAHVPDQYIILLNSSAKDVASTARELARQNGGQILFTYTKAVRGFAAKLSAQAAEALKNNPNVSSVEQDQYIQVNDTVVPNNYSSDRIDQKSLPLDNKFTYNSDGSGVNIYVIDTGVRITHQDLAGRAYYAYTNVFDGYGADDCYGHGTHVSGIAAGTKFGIAKKANIFSVRAIDCKGYGTNSSLIDALDWVAQNHISPAVINMSLSGGKSDVLNQATENVIASGVVVATAAGNSTQDACNWSPASAPDALTVGASTEQDGWADFSNYGSCVDLYALGTNIWSDWNTSDTAENQLSGTSMATPVVAGLAAQYLSQNRSATPAQVNQAIVSNATPLQYAGASFLEAYDLFIPALPPVASPDTSSPSTPTGLSGAATDPEHISLTWNAASDNTGVAGYKIYKSGALLTEVSGNSFVDSMVSGPGPFTYNVASFDAAGNTSAKSSSVSINSADPLSISSYTVTVNSTTQATISWTSNYQTTAYVYYYIRNKYQGEVPDLNPATKHSVVLSGLSRGTSYTYQINAFDATGDSITVSGSFKTPRK